MIQRPVSVEDCLQHTPFVRRLAHSLVGEADADDLVQEALLTAMQRPPHKRAAVRGWLASVVRNLAHNRRLSDSRRRARELRGAELRNAPSAADTVERDSTYRHLRGALELLSEEQREVLLLRFYDSQAPRVIASRLGLPVETVRSRQKRALARLRESLDQEYGGDRRAWGVAFATLGGTARSSRRGLIPSLTAATLLLGGLLAYQAHEPSKPPVEQVSIASVSLDTAQAGGSRSRAALESGSRELVSEPEPADVPSLADPKAMKLAFELVDSLGAPVEADILFCEGDSSYVWVVSTDLDGLAEVEVSDAYLGQTGNPQWSEAVALTVMAAGRERSAIRIIEPRPGKTLPLRIVLGPRTAVALAGFVVDSDGLPVAGADVTVGKPGVETRALSDGSLDIRMPDTNRTALDGSFSFEGLASGRRPILVEAGGFSACWTQCDLPLERDLVLRIDRGARLTGIVRSQDGTVVPGALVHCAWEAMLFGYQSVPSAHAIADEYGVFALEGVGRGDLMLWAQDPDEPDRVAHKVFEQGEELRWEAILRQVQGIHLRIVDARGEPLEGAHALLTPPAGSMQWRGDDYSASDGRIDMYCLPDTPLDVSVLAEEYSADFPALLFGVEPSDEVRVLRLPDGPPALLEFHGLLSDAGGTPLPGHVRLNLDQQALASRLFEVDATGGFAGWLPAGEYHVSVLSDLFGCAELDTIQLTAEHYSSGLNAPRLGRLVYDGVWRDGYGYELVQTRLNSGGPIRLRIAGGLGPPPAYWSLFPGQFELRVHDTAFMPVACHEVSLHAGARVVVGPSQK